MAIVCKANYVYKMKSQNLNRFSEDRYTIEHLVSSFPGRCTNLLLIGVRGVIRVLTECS